MICRRFWWPLLAALAIAAGLHAQEQPLRVNGTFFTGFYNTVTRGDADQSVSFIPVGARFDINGFLFSPDLISFSAQPELTEGPQASEAGIQGGNGIRFRVTLLRKRFAPLTFRYANIQVEDVYFGSLTQVSGYTLKNRTKDLGLTWELKPNNLPVTIIDWGTGSVNSRAGIAGVPDYLSDGSHLNADTKYERWGWDLQGFAHRQEQRSDLLTSLDGGRQTGSLLEKVTQYQGSARRGFLGDSELYTAVGNQSTSSLLFTLPIDLSTRYAHANMRLFQKRRWKTSLRANYTTNLASQLLAQAASTLHTPGAVTTDETVLAPFSHGISSFNAQAMTTVTLAHGFGVFGSVEKSTILSSTQETPLNADYLTTQAGVTYSGKFGWGNLAGEYAREFGIGSVTGQSGTIQGQNYVVSAQRGKSGGTQFEVSVHGNDQSIQNVQPISNRTFSVESLVSHRIAGNFSARVGGGWQWGTIVNAANEFHTNGYTARAGIEHPRFQATASLNNSLSNTLPLYGQLLSGLGLGSILLTQLQVIPSDYRSMSFSLHANPLRKLELSAMWTRSRQHLDGYLNNDFQLLNIYATYHFRRIKVEMGFIRADQMFALYPTTLRQRLYVRVMRNVKLL